MNQILETLQKISKQNELILQKIDSLDKRMARQEKRTVKLHKKICALEPKRKIGRPKKTHKPVKTRAQLQKIETFAQVPDERLHIICKKITTLKKLHTKPFQTLYFKYLTNFLKIEQNHVFYRNGFHAHIYRHQTGWERTGVGAFTNLLFDVSWPKFCEALLEKYEVTQEDLAQRKNEIKFCDSRFPALTGKQHLRDAFVLQ
jgi:hypothetical protein